MSKQDFYFAPVQSETVTFGKIKPEQILRRRRKDGVCEIMGISEVSYGRRVRTRLSLGGVVIRHDIYREHTHSEPCANCPDHNHILRTWFQDGQDIGKMPERISTTGSATGRRN